METSKVAGIALVLSWITLGLLWFPKIFVIMLVTIVLAVAGSFWQTHL